MISSETMGRVGARGGAGRHAGGSLLGMLG